jgi:hypothetical protein
VFGLTPAGEYGNLSDMVHSDLSRWLSTLEPEDLAGLLARRPDAYASRVPGDLHELAGRLVQQTAVAALTRELPLPAIEIIEALQALLPPDPRAGVPRAALADLLGRPADDPELDAALRVLSQRALAWPTAAGDRLHLTPPLHAAFARPLNLGRPAAQALEQHTVTELRKIAGRLGLPAQGTKTELLTDLATWLADRDNVTALVAEAPDDTRAMLQGAASGTPMIEIPYSTTALPPVMVWAVERGLLVRPEWDYAEVPREVGLALRGGGWHAPFTPVPPAPSLEAVDANVAAEAGAAATALLDLLGALLDACTAAPVAVRKAGGVGVREVRRLAVELHADEAMIRLLLELASAAELLAPSAEGVLPTAEYDVWAAQEPAEQLAIVLGAWLRMPAAPMLAGERVPLTRDALGPIAAELRPIMLRVLDELPAGLSVAAPATFLPLVRWMAPVPLFEVGDDWEDFAAGMWRELVAVGAGAHGAITPLGRALVEGRPVAAAAERLLRTSTGTARFQADLTVVVTGQPAPPLRELLDLCADREARGAASIWRFSSRTVRRALDSGMSTVDLLARLREVASGGTLPQPLEYLVDDAGRRHGRLRVRAVTCVIRSDDTALLTEIALAHALRGLDLTQLAPTVLASGAPVTRTLAALRQAGYAPLAEDDTGAVVVERPAKPRIDTPVAARGIVRAPRTHRPSKSTVDTQALARKLLAVRPKDRQLSLVPPQRDGGDDPFTHIAKRAPHLPDRAVKLLASAIEHGTPVRIEYTDGHGRTSSRVIEDAALNEHLVEAWCRLRADERAFHLDRIDAVYPAT